MAKGKKRRLPKCAYCNKTITEPFYTDAGEPKPDTDPSLVHRTYDPELRGTTVYHHCGHFTVYVFRPEELSELK